MICIGTSGFKYPEWKGKFYPEKIAPAAMLPFYATRFNTTEINYTFYRMPTEKLLQDWATEVPSDFRFSFKAPRRITHDAQLKNCGALADDFLRLCGTLEARFAAALFQLPPSLEKDVSLLRDFLQSLTKNERMAFEFRHRSWFSDDVFDLLESRNAALCIADSEKLSTPVQMTADFGYFRLRNEGYGTPDLERWAKEISLSARKRDVFVYLKHEESGIGPRFAAQLQRILGITR